MKKYTIIFGVAVLTFGLVACNEDTTTDTAVSASVDDAYPMDTCPVSGEKLGSMGEPVVVTHDSTTVKLCCESCIDKFNANPGKYTAMVKNAAGG